MKLLLIREVAEVRGVISQGLGLIATIVKEIVTVRILDNNSLYVTHSRKQILKKIKEFSPDFIGFHVNALNIHKTLLLVQEIKQSMGHIGLLGGGLHAFYEPGEILDLGIHIVAIDEADLTIIPLLKALEGSVDVNKPFRVNAELTERLQAIPGLLFDNEASIRINTGRPNYIEDLDQLPFIDHTLYNLEDYIRKPSDGYYVTNTLLTQRGCPFACSFCQGDEEHGGFRLARANSPQYRVAYMQSLYERHGHNYLIFLDTNFTLNRKKTLEFCELVVAAGLHEKITFQCETNAFAIIDTTLATALRHAGCVEIGLGVERLTQEAQMQINKRLKLETIYACIRNISAAGIRLSVNVLVGFPFDTPETIREEEKQFTYLLDLMDSISVSVNVVLPLPGTQIYHQTRYKKWYLGKEYIRWKPPFYHYAYNYNGNAWHANYFDLNDESMTAIRKMHDDMHTKRIQRTNSRLVSFLYFFIQLLAKFSFMLFHLSPLLERIIFAPVKVTYNVMWKYMVSRYYINR